MNTWDVLVEAVALVEAMLLAAVLAHRVLVTTLTTQQLGGDGLYSGGDVERWFSLWAGHHRPTSMTTLQKDVRASSLPS